MSRVVNLIYVDGISANSNKYYNMFESEDKTQFTVEYGRVGATKTVLSYSIHQWDKKYREKVKKGYTDVSNLRQVDTVVAKKSDNVDFDNFYNHFSKFATSMTSKSYLVDSCTPQQLKEAQDVLNNLLKVTSTDDANKMLTSLYKVIPRRMHDVRSYMIGSHQDYQKEIPKIVTREQDALDAMDSSNVIHEEDVFGSLGITFELASAAEQKMLSDLIMPSNTGYKTATIHKCYKVTHQKTQPKFDKWVDAQGNKTTQLLFHGTRNPNIFSILKSGLLIRPSNAVSFAGSAYGDGIYHSAHTQKSLGYTGWDTDKIFFIQNVHMGNFYTYSGYYRDGKDISRSEMNYKGLQKKGYDSLYVKAGDGLLNSEYIVYNAEQTTVNYLVWFK